MRKAEAISVIGVINDLFLKPLEHMEFAHHFPKYEYQNLAILSYESVSCGVPLTISLGTCADYQEQRTIAQLGLELVKARNDFKQIA